MQEKSPIWCRVGGNSCAPSWNSSSSELGSLQWGVKKRWTWEGKNAVAQKFGSLWKSFLSSPFLGALTLEKMFNKKTWENVFFYIFKQAESWKLFFFPFLKNWGFMILTIKKPQRMRGKVLFWQHSSNSLGRQHTDSVHLSRSLWQHSFSISLVFCFSCNYLW